MVILALPGAAVADLTAAHGEALVDTLVIDATNQMGAEVANARASLPTSVRYARAFNTLGGENMADPVIDGQQLDMFFSAPAADHDTVATVIDAVGLRPVYLGEDKEALTDALFRFWIARNGAGAGAAAGPRAAPGLKPRPETRPGGAGTWPEPPPGNPGAWA